MKKLLVLIVLVGAMVTCLFNGLHIGTPCPADAAAFAEHIGEGGSDHIYELGGPEAVIKFLQSISNGSTKIAVYGDSLRTVITATSTPYGPVVIIYGSSVLPTMFPTSTQYINNLIQYMPKRTSNVDLNAARSTARCFSKALEPIPATASIPVREQSFAATMLGVLALLAILILIMGGIRFLGSAIA